MRPIFFYFLALFSSGLSISCDDKIEPGSAKKTPPLVRGVSVTAAKMTDQPMIYEAVGTVIAGIRSTLSGKTLGVVQKMQVREGDRVRKGDILVVIDPRQVVAGEQKARAALSEARKALKAALSSRDAARTSKELAYATYDRHRQLKKNNMISAQVFEETEARYRQAEAGLRRSEALIDAANDRIRQAKASLTEASVTRKDAVITAPHDGIITEKKVDKGDLASPGMPLLTLETTDGFCVDSVLPENYIHHVSPMQTVIVKIPALNTGPLEGTVCTIVPSADPKSRSFVVKINLPIALKTRSGMFARVEIPTGRTRKFLIPKSAVVERGQLTGIYLVDTDSIAHFRLIRLGKTFGDAVEVISGLKEGDRYALDTLTKLEDGARIEVTL